MAPHSSTLAWKIPWMEEPGRLQSMGSLRVGHDWATSLALFTFMHWRRKWQPTSVFLPGESQGRGSLVGCQKSMGSHRVGHDWSDLAAAAAAAGFHLFWEACTSISSFCLALSIWFYILGKTTASPIFEGETWIRDEPYCLTLPKFLSLELLWLSKKPDFFFRGFNFWRYQAIFHPCYF